MDQPSTSTEGVSDAVVVSRSSERRKTGSSMIGKAKLGGKPHQTAETLRKVYRPIENELAAVDARLHRELQSRYEALRPVLQHGTQLGGKRLRPALLLLSGLASCSHDTTLGDDHIVMGSVVEMVHTATLIHDDVLDKAATRRHVPTINARWNDDTSILLGDYLFAQSFYLAATLPSTLACRWVGQAARAVCAK